jgi:hypothetical protein
VPDLEPRIEGTPARIRHTRPERSHVSVVPVRSRKAQQKPPLRAGRDCDWFLVRILWNHKASISVHIPYELWISVSWEEWMMKYVVNKFTILGNQYSSLRKPRERTASPVAITRTSLRLSLRKQETRRLESVVSGTGNPARRPGFRITAGVCG